MANNTVLNPGVGGNTIRDEDIGGVHFPVAKLVLGNAGVNDGDVSATNPLPVTGTLAFSGAVDQGAGSGAGAFWSVRVTDGGAFYDLPLRGQLPAALVGGRLSVDGSGVVQPVSAAALPLPAGASTEATLTAVAALLADVASETTLATLGTEATLATLGTEATLAMLGTEATLATRLADATITARLGTLGQKPMATSAPVVVASDQSAIPVTGVVAIIPVAVGTQGNAWNATAVGAGGLSLSVDTQYTPSISVFGNADAATTIIVQYSQDDVNFYGGLAITIPALGSDFVSNITIGARYVRLQSTAAATITATIAGKT